MNLFLMRHAHAVSEYEDVSRPLSPRGQAQVRIVGEHFDNRGLIDATKIWHSPLQRARETAELFVRYANLAGFCREVEGLEPFDDVRGVARRLSGFNYPLMIVGHEPHLGRLVSLLVSGTVDHEIIHFHKGGICCLKRVETRSQARLWSLHWYLTPGLLLREDPYQES
ncbi:MAG: phosphohistidine phosphatase SixA [Opitutaceae bacterium]